MIRSSVGCIVVASLLLAGCGEGSPEAEAPSSSSTPADTVTVDMPPTDAGATDTAPTTTPTPAAPGRDDAPATITAEAAFEPRQGGVSLRVAVHGLVPGVGYGVNVHEGGCRARGPVRLPLGRVTARDDGSASVRMTLDSDRLPDMPHYVQVQGPDGPVACADIHDAAR